MDLKHSGFPVPSDYFGVLWGLSGIEDLVVLEHGSPGTCSYNAFNYRIMNRQSPKGKLFTSGMDQDDVVMGRDDKIVEAVRELDYDLHPEIIALVATGVTSVIGLDLCGIIEEIQPQTRARLISFPHGGFAGDYNQGIKEVFRVMMDQVVEPAQHRPFSVNIIGPTIDSFNNVSDLAELVRMLTILGAEVNTVFTCQTDVKGIRNMASASLNLVTRDLGLEAARVLKERFGIPYLYGLPFGVRGSVEWMQNVAEILGLYPQKRTISRELQRYGFSVLELISFMQKFDHLRALISCPYDYALGLARWMTDEWGIPPAAVALSAKPENPNFLEEFERLSVSRVLIEPDSETMMGTISDIKPHIIFGNSYDLQIARDVPIKVHAAFPAFDHVYKFDGTPFVGLRGHAYLTQTLVNSLNQNPEVFRN
jgi:nitrogenase molybdenum-cofactor synthesis protein NifE